MFTLKSPSEYLSWFRNRLTPQQKTAFFSTVLTGFLCHLFILTNSMYNHDDIRYLYVDFDKPELGRWLQTYAAGITSYFSSQRYPGTDLCGNHKHGDRTDVQFEA